MTTTGEKVLAALNINGQKQRNNTYRLNSPFRAGSDSQAFHLTLSADKEHGAYHDKVSGEFGSLYTLAEKLGIEVVRNTAADTKRAYRDLAEYAAAHGVTGDVLQAAGWKETIYFDHDHNKERPAIEIPTAGGNRYRFLDGEKPTYRSPFGYKNCWYGLKRAAVIAGENKPLVLCNGAPSVIVAQHYGVPAIALAGGGQRIPSELLEELLSTWKGDLIIAMDCDSEGQLATRAYHEQLPDAHIVDLGMTTRGDLADFCMLHKESTLPALTGRAVKFEAYADAETAATLMTAIRELIAARKAEERTSPTLELALDKAQQELDLLKRKVEPESVKTFTDIVSQNRKLLEERRANPQEVRGLRSNLSRLDRIIGGWQGGRLHVIYGDTNMGKSTLAVTLATRFLNAAPGLVLPTESPVVPYMDKMAANIAMLSYDQIETGIMTDEEYKRVVRAYDMLEDPHCNFLDMGSPTPAALERAVREGMQKHSYKWLLVDSMSKMKVPGVDGIYETTRLVADCLQDLAREFDLMVLATCQVGRNLKDRQNKTPLPNDALGAGTVEQNGDVIMSLYNHNHYVKLGVSDPDEKFPDGSALVRVIKHRWRDGLNKGSMLKFVGGSGFYEMETEYKS